MNFFTFEVRGTPSAEASFICDSVIKPASSAFF